MAHKIIDETQQAKPKKKIKLPSISGRFGFSFMFGKKEVFVGVNVSEIDTAEFRKIIRRNVFPGKGRVVNL